MSARLGFPKNTPLTMSWHCRAALQSLEVSNYYQVEEIFDKGISEAEQLGFRAMITSGK
jgi:hypothetical protein